MSYEVRSLIERRAVLITVAGSVTIPQIRAGGVQTDALVTSGEAPVHVVIDAARMTDVPFVASRLFEESPFLRNPNLGHIVVYGVASPALRLLAQIVSQMAPLHYMLVQTLPDALAYLHTQDSRIDADAVDDLADDDPQTA